MDLGKPGKISERSIAIVALTRYGVTLALQLFGKIPGSACYVPARHGFAVSMGAIGFDRLGSLVPEIWREYRAFIFIMSSGIVVRQIGPLLSHKTVDPAVVVLDERGRYAISLVSGHLGGANRLAEEVARLIGGQAVITTASDVSGKPALDLMAREAGLEVENSPMVSRLARALVEEEEFWIYDPDRCLYRYLGGEGNICWYGENADMEGNAARIAERGLDASVGIWVSEYGPPPGIECLILRPRNLVVGVGCNRGTSSGEILECLHALFEREGLSTLSIRNLASIDIKAGEPGILEATRTLRRPVHFYSREDIENIEVPNPSRVVAKHIGVQSVCEATALLSARSGILIIPKQKTPNVTLAVARVHSPS